MEVVWEGEREKEVQRGNGTEAGGQSMERLRAGGNRAVRPPSSLVCRDD